MFQALCCLGSLTFLLLPGAEELLKLSLSRDLLALARSKHFSTWSIIKLSHRVTESLVRLRPAFSSCNTRWQVFCFLISRWIRSVPFSSTLRFLALLCAVGLWAFASFARLTMDWLCFRAQWPSRPHKLLRPKSILPKRRSRALRLGRQMQLSQHRQR